MIPINRPPEYLLPPDATPDEASVQFRGLREQLNDFEQSRGYRIIKWNENLDGSVEYRVARLNA